MRKVMMLISLVAISGCVSVQSRYEKTKRNNTPSAYQEFLAKYPQSDFTPDAHRRLESVLFEEAKTKGTITAFTQFLTRYPESQFRQEANTKLEALYFDQAKANGTIRAFDEFLSKYPNGNLATAANQAIAELRKHLYVADWIVEITSTPDSAEVFDAQEDRRKGELIGKTPLKVKIWTVSFFGIPGSKGQRTLTFHRPVLRAQNGFYCPFLITSQGKVVQRYAFLPSALPRTKPSGGIDAGAGLAQSLREGFIIRMTGEAVTVETVPNDFASAPPLDSVSKIQVNFAEEK